MKIYDAERDCILIKDLEIKACHGVNAEEKTEPQRFLVSADLKCDFLTAANSDDISRTASYSAAKKLITAVVTENCFCLLETLAVTVAESLLKEYETVKSARIKIKKPDAPMSGVFDYVGVETEREWVKVYLSVGSNVGDKEANLDFAAESLMCYGKIKRVRESKRIATAPYGGVAENEFLNSAIEIETLYAPRELLAVLKGIEAARGRKRDVRWGNRTLDIDIIFYGGYAVCDNDLCIPHADMENRLFVLEPLFELNPNLLHPVNGRRISEMLAELKYKKI